MSLILLTFIYNFLKVFGFPYSSKEDDAPISQYEPLSRKL